jgi:hypothetical protein
MAGNVTGFGPTNKPHLPSPGGVEVLKNGASVGTRGGINLLNPQIAADNPGNDRVDVTLPATELYRITGIDATTPAEHNFTAIPAGRTAVVTGAIVVCISSTGPPTNGPRCGIGIAAGADDLFSERRLVGFTAAEDTWHFECIGKKIRAPATSVIKFGIDQAPPGAATMVVNVYLLGYLDT